MQTFLPYADFEKSAAILDRKRLGKQRVEAMMVLDMLTDPDKQSRWRNHPCVRMWAGYEWALAEYIHAMCDEWIRRGYTDNIKIRIEMPPHQTIMPHWIGNRWFHRSHQSNLLRKDPVYYGQFFKNVEPDLPYLWPVSKEDYSAKRPGRVASENSSSNVADCVRRHEHHRHV